MALYRYVKAKPGSGKSFTPNIPSAAPFFLILFGFVLLGVVFYPLFSFGSKYGNSVKLANPLVEKEVLGQSSSDLTKASNWFPEYPQKPSRPLMYTISIEKLNIKDARVLVGSDDLSESLIHFGGTAMPGEKGNSVVFGHSASPLFRSPNKYLTIFTELNNLKDGDKIVVSYDKVIYTYIVYGRLVVEPTDFSVLNSESDFYTMSLITCVPPGYDWGRLVVKARLSEGNL